MEREDVVTEYNRLKESGESVEHLMPLIDQMVSYRFMHQLAPNACDFLFEMGLLDKIMEFIDDATFKRVYSYLFSVVQYLPHEEERQTIMNLLYRASISQHQYASALVVALRLDNMEMAEQIFTDCPNESLKKQLAFIMARHQAFFEQDDEELQEIMSNSKLNELFLQLARDFDITDAKTPEDVYKSHLVKREHRPLGQGTYDSARENLASTFVNAFVNCGFGNDTLVTVAEGNKWIFNHKDAGIISASASLGSILRWDVEGGLAQIDKFMYASDRNVQAGALLAAGLICGGVRNECDPALGLLVEYLEHADTQIRVAALIGLSFAYAGTGREDLEMLSEPLLDPSAPIEVVSAAALACGVVYCGTADEQMSQLLLQALMERDADFNHPTARFISVALGLLFMNRGEMCETMLEAVRVLRPPISTYAEITIEGCAYAGTGDVMRIQKFVHMALEDNKHSAALSVVLLCMGEELGSQMALRHLEHFIQYGDEKARRVAPLAYALLSTSNPEIDVTDMLSRLSHDVDAEVAMNAAIALGLVAAGTNNGRISSLLRQLSVYYAKEPNNLFAVRIGQGLVHLGKGALTLSPFHSDNMLCCRPALASLLVVLHACLDINNLILGSHHYLMYYLLLAARPRVLMTLRPDLTPLPVPVRVGQAVDVAGQPGCPKSITGFQTHTTPVLIPTGHRAELATTDYTSLTPVLEDFVILDAVDESAADSDKMDVVTTTTTSA
eukprot:gnl/Trimastix_PCT/202.p1 GENE.gnl/Trimastix_PCT/202~~gnl/Trimastix_PCT/202.p1  ORF type:complete len:730 (+),score=201.77 gnl/Trimastix_PCT/202:89-2278(+)